MRTILVLLALVVPLGCGLVPDVEPIDDAPAAPVVVPPAVTSAPPPAPSYAAPPPRSYAPPPASRRPARPSFDALPRLAPQARDVGSLYERSRATHEGAIERGMLVCRARVHGGGFDDGVFSGGADVALAARIGDAPIRSTPQSSLRTFSFPVARLEPGDDVWIRVIDRDVFFDDLIAEGTVRYERAPFSLRMGQADVECRSVDPALVARRAQTAVAALERAIERLDGAEPDLAARDLGYPSDRAARVRAAADDVLAWTDASDDAYRSAIDRALAFDERWERRASDAVEAAADELPPSSTPVPFRGVDRISVSEVLCGERASALARSSDELRGAGARCIAIVTLEVGRARTLPPVASPSAQWEAWAIDESGNAIDARIVARRREGAFLPGDQPVTIEEHGEVELVMSLVSSTEPVLLRVRDGGRPVVLRIP